MALLDSIKTVQDDLATLQIKDDAQVNANSVFASAQTAKSVADQEDASAILKLNADLQQLSADALAAQINRNPPPPPPPVTISSK